MTRYWRDWKMRLKRGFLDDNNTRVTWIKGFGLLLYTLLPVFQGQVQGYLGKHMKNDRYKPLMPALVRQTWLTIFQYIWSVWVTETWWDFYLNLSSLCSKTRNSWYYSEYHYNTTYRHHFALHLWSLATSWSNCLVTVSR